MISSHKSFFTRPMSSACLVFILTVSILTISSMAYAGPAKTVVLKFATPDPVHGFVSAAHQKWADELEKRTDGRYRVEIAWSAAMGPFDKHYELVENGIADVAFFTATPPAPFDLGLISSMPWNLPEAERTLTSYWELYKQGHFDKEFAQVKPLFVWNGTGSALFSTKPINSISDLKGMKIATTVPYSIKFLKAVDSVPVSLVPPEQLGALEKGVVKGTWLVWVAMLPFQLDSVCNYCIEPVFGNMECAVAMNKNTFKKLPDDVKKIVDDMSEDVLLPASIEGYNVADAAARKVFAKKGGVTTAWSKADYAEMDRIIAPYWEEWFKDMEKRGLAARETSEAYWHILKDLGVEKPAFGYSPK